ncbi:MAG: DUF2169 domain-containing protein [Acetobacter sp.]
MKIINETKCAVTIIDDSKGEESPVIIVKACFDLTQNLPAQFSDNCPEFSNDVLYKDEIGRSLAWANDLERYKPNFDFLVLGSFFAPEGKAVPQSMVGFQFGPMEKRLRIIGPRVATVDGDGQWSVTPPTPLTELALRWEFSAGGLDDARNPFGMGAEAMPRENNCPGALYKLPMIEAVDDPPWTPVRSVVPANMVPEPSFFSSRQKKMGTRDRRWTLFRAPLPPLDFDPSVANSAPAGQQAVGEPYGHEVMRFANMHPSHPIFSATLPESVPFVAFAPVGSDHACPVWLKLDTIVAQPDQEKLTLLWRAPLPDIKSSHDVELLVCEIWPVEGSRQKMADEVSVWFAKDKADAKKAEQLKKEKISKDAEKDYEEHKKSTDESNEAEKIILKNDLEDMIKDIDIPEELKNIVRNSPDDPKALGELVDYAEDLFKKLEKDYGHVYKPHLNK